MKMNETPVTRPSLLLRVRDASDEAAWRQFVQIYTPLIYSYCRGRGLQDFQAADVAQETMRAVVRAIARFEYDPIRGKFRNWLLTVVQSRLNNFVAREQRQPVPASDSTLQRALDKDPSEDQVWEADYYRAVFNSVAEQIKSEFQESTWRAFWETTINERDGKAVAEALGLSIKAVYVAKNRVIARIKEEIRRIDETGDLPSCLGV